MPVTAEVRAAAERALEDQVHEEDLAEVLEHVCQAVAGRVDRLPEVIETVDGARRLYWPAAGPQRAERPPDPTLFG